MPDEEPAGDEHGHDLGSFIRAQREMAHLSLRQLATMTDVSNAYLSQIERGLHEPSMRVLRSVASALGVAPETMLEQAGFLDEAVKEAASRVSTEDAIRCDPKLTDEERDALIAVYRSYVAGKD